MLDIQTYTPPPAPKPPKRRADPVLLGSVGAGLLGFAVIAALFSGEPQKSKAAMGGPDEPKQATEKQASVTRPPEERIRRLRNKKAVLSRREEILRYQLEQLEERQRRTGNNDPELAEQLRRSRQTLVMLLKDQEQADEDLVAFLRQVWEADGKTHVATMGMETNNRIVLSWPAEPQEGISADFEDPYYAKRFGMDHEAIDIPLPQRSEIRAAADGVVATVADNGMGYNYVIVRHDGFATLYGHVNEFTVKKGQTVKEGDVVALSGGQPGTAGAGALTTGPHLHFELIAGGDKIDPMPYLPYSSRVEVVRKWREKNH